MPPQSKKRTSAKANIASAAPTDAEAGPAANINDESTTTNATVAAPQEGKFSSTRMDLYEQEVQRTDFSYLTNVMKKVTEGNIAQRTRDNYESYLRQGDIFLAKYGPTQVKTTADKPEILEAFTRPTSRSVDMILAFISAKCLNVDGSPRQKTPPSPKKGKAKKTSKKGASKKADEDQAAAGNEQRIEEPGPSPRKKQKTSSANPTPEEVAACFAEEEDGLVDVLNIAPPGNAPQELREMEDLPASDLPELQAESWMGGGPSVARTIQAAFRWRFWTQYRLVWPRQEKR